MRAQAFNDCIGGSYAHGKNYGLLLAAKGPFRLAPLYDVISILPYLQSRKDARLAMSIDRHYRFDKIQPRHWEAQARAASYRPERMLAHIRDVLTRLDDDAAALAKIFKSNGMGSSETDILVRLLAERCATARLWQ
jgi:serine/threonine-protein kinase HipA